MAIQESEPKVRPSALWYLLVAALWIGAAILAIVTVVPIIKVFTSDLHPVSNGGTINVPSDGVTVYTTRGVNNTVCALTDGSGDTTPLDPFNNGDEFDFNPANGPHVYALGVTPDNFPSGDYTLACVRDAGGSLYYGERIDFVEIGTRVVVGFGGGGLLGLAGLIVLIVLLVKRHNSKARIRQYQAAAAYGSYPASYGQYGSPTGGYQPPPGSYPPPGGYPPQGGGTYPPTYPDAQPGGTPPPPPPAYPPPDDDGSGPPTQTDDDSPPPRNPS